MTDDLLGRLRLAATPLELCDVWTLTVLRAEAVHEAADEIERLRAENAKLQQRIMRLEGMA